MAQSVDRDAGHAVQIAATFGIPQPNAFAAREGDGEPGIGIHQMRHFISPKKHTAAKAAVWNCMKAKL